LLSEAEEYAFGDELPHNLPSLDKIPELDKELIKHPRNDLGNARRLLARYGEDIKYVTGHGWYGWTGTYWSMEDGTALVRIAAQDTSDLLSGEALAVAVFGPHDDEKPKDFIDRVKSWYRFARNSGNTPHISAMIREAQSLAEISPNAMDKNPFLFNVSNGTLNLRADDNGDEDFDGIVLEAHTRSHNITKIASVEYNPAAVAPQFRRFMEDILPDDEIRIFMQRWFGYCLTGSIKEQVIVMCYGSGSNGKSVLMSLMNRLMGRYAQVLPFASLLHDDKRRGSEASPDLAQLPGARLVTAAEPEIGAKFSESMIKQVTGGEKIKARHLRQDFFEFRPEFKPMLSFNNKPYIKGQDDGIWRRILLVPFEQKFVDGHELESNPGAKLKDKNLEGRLWEEEASGILNWMLDGYRMWAEGGLQIPDKVRAATAEYRQESNPVREFLGTACDYDIHASIQANRLYDAFKLWCIDNMMEVKSIQWFGRRAKELSIEKFHDGRNYYYKGFSLAPDMEERLSKADERKHHRKDMED
jgi:putative DNA primase/helicase